MFVQTMERILPIFSENSQTLFNTDLLYSVYFRTFFKRKKFGGFLEGGGDEETFFKKF